MQERAADLADRPHRQHVARVQRAAVRGAALPALAGHGEDARFIRDHVNRAVGEVEAVSGYRNPALNHCARGSERSAHLDYFALDLVPVRPLERARHCFAGSARCTPRTAAASGAGLGFYAFQRFHIDTRSFRRWGSAGPRGNESPCAVIERGGDPLAPPLPPPPPPPLQNPTAGSPEDPAPPAAAPPSQPPTAAPSSQPPAPQPPQRQPPLTHSR